MNEPHFDEIDEIYRRILRRPVDRSGYEHYARRIADGELIGSFQSGRFGYWTRGAVANLDGVVDGAAARALREGRLATHLRERRIEWIIEEPHLLSPLFFNAPRSEPLSLTLVREGAFAAYRVGAPDGS